ncbi:multicopper oxidase family protein [Jiella marina]|uniref:multicopper oxidase family protein n=1 Tax=Jiella sp. LLJ827 TaxID=2917712 RepID=UPI0021013533|nr:multicopper oxidase family protein [Jiella sp. LLJ827]MCQ0988287.1 multicopper oxidase family protein [Jiella sp. LLJ827]
MLNRRGFVKAALAAPFVPSLAGFLSSRAQAEAGKTLKAAPATAQLVPADVAGPTPVWAFNGTAPGPVLRVKAGERLKVMVENGLDQPTSVHWHGIRIANGMDGVPGLTQEAIEPGASFSYDFVAPDPGTYWYHSHDRSWEQNARGLHGALIVEEAEPWAGADRDLVLVVDDWRLTEDGTIDESFGHMMDWSHAGRLGNVVTVNGSYRPKFAVRPNERIRVRLINASNARTMAIGLAGTTARLLALDGMPVGLNDVAEPVQLAPAQRADLLADFAASETPLPIAVETRDGPVPIAEIVVSGDPVREASDDPIGLPTSGPGVLPNLSGAKRVELLMEGGAMGGMSGAMHDGRMMDMRALVDEGRVWAFNGIAGDMDEPLARFAKGSPALIAIRNDTGWPHAMHVHGHHFRVVSRNGKPIADPALRDTDLMMPDETIEIAFIADNPGKWLLHCHMLEHAAAGMMTWFEVA